MRGRTVHCIANKTTFQSSDYLHCLDRNDADNLYLEVHNPIVPTIFTGNKEFYNTLIIRCVTWWNVMKYIVKSPLASKTMDFPKNKSYIFAHKRLTYIIMEQKKTEYITLHLIVFGTIIIIGVLARQTALHYGWDEFSSYLIFMVCSIVIGAIYLNLQMVFSQLLSPTIEKGFIRF